MPITITFDPNSINKQAAVIEDATPFNDGAMSKAQAKKLAGLSPGGGGYPSPTTTHDTVVAGNIPINGAILNTLHLVALSGNSTMSIANPVAGETYQFKITNAGSFNITAWPTGFTWPGGVTPTLTVSGVDVVSAIYDGTSFEATIAQAFA